MSLPLPFSEDHRDCIQEISNVAMGAAGEALALFTKQFVVLSIPVIRCIPPESVTEAMASLQGYDRVSGMAESFTAGEIRGTALLMLTESSFNDLSEFTGRKLTSDASARKLLQELSQTVTTTCLEKLAEQLEESLVIESESIAVMMVELQDFALSKLGVSGFSCDGNECSRMISIEINLHIEDHPFNCDLLLLIPEPAIDSLVAHIDKFL